MHVITRSVAGIAIVTFLQACGAPAAVGPTPSQSAAPTAAAIATPVPTPTATPAPTPAGPLGDGRQIHTATLLPDGSVVIAGGFSYSKAAGDRAIASAVRWDPRTGAFSQSGSMRTARGSHTATLLRDGTVLLAGGGPPSWFSSPVNLLASAEIYDPAARTFTETGFMTSPRAFHTATLLADGRVLVIGGVDRADHAVATAEIYDPKTGDFSRTGSLAEARAFHAATLLTDGRVLVVGGDPGHWNYDGPFSASAEIYDPVTGTFNPTGSMATSRSWHTATLLADGRVIVAGGEHARTDLTSAELYDPTTGTFSTTGSMTTGRVYHAAVALNDGHVLVIGGGSDYSGGKFLDSAELYDPATGTWTATGSMVSQRNFETATLLADGRVMVAGGFGAFVPVATAEIYDPATGMFAPAAPGG